MKNILLPDIPDNRISHLNVDAHTVVNLMQAYRSIPRDGQINEVSLTELFQNQDKEYLDGPNNHFQGMARSKDGQFLFVSGGYKKGSKSHLFILKMTSYQPSNPSSLQLKRQFLSNTLYSGGQPIKDKGIGVFTIDTTYWHAGGISLMGDVLAVALEKKDDSRIDIIDVSDPLHPKRIKTIINRPNKKAGCVSMIRLPNDHFLVAIWTEAGGRRFDFYLSSTKSLTSDYIGPTTVRFDEIGNRTAVENPRIQNMQFIKDQSGNYGIVGLYNTSIVSLGLDKCYFLTMTLDKQTKGANPVLKKPTIVEKLIIHPRTNRKYYNFGHVGGVYVDGKNRLIIYGGGTKRKGIHKNMFTFVEFATLMADNSIFEEFTDGLVELIGYKASELKKQPPSYEIDRILKLDLTKHPRLDVYKDIEGLGGNFNDKTTSVRWCLPTNSDVVFYEDSNKNTGDDGNNPHPERKNHLKLEGSGQHHLIQDLRVKPNNILKHPNKSFWKKISAHSTL